MQQRVAVRSDPDPQARVAGVMAAHGRALLAVAHRWSLCHDDALDAYQRALEIYLRRMDTVDPATEGAWMRVVVKHEALAIRRARQGVAGSDEVDIDAVVAAPQRSTEELVAGGERVSRSAEALRALKPDEARALMLKAEGLSYHEIAERCDWTYTKVNRTITEGRRRFIKAYAAIESGEECDRFAPVLAALAAGAASSAELVEVRPHLRHCAACRATVRELHMSALRRVRLLLPAFLLAPLHWLQSPSRPSIEPEQVLRDGAQLQLPVTPGSSPHDLAPATTGAPDLADRLTPHLTDIPDQLSLELPEYHERLRRLRGGGLRDRAADLAGRASSSDVATTIHIFLTGGGRIGAVAATIGFCVSGIGAGALCVATGVVKAPAWILDERPHARPPARTVTHRHRPARSPRAYRQAHLPASVRFAEASATPRPTPTPEPHPRVRSQSSRPSPSADPSQGTAPSSHESAPISQVASNSAPEFSPEQQSTSAPAYSPPTGGGEFLP